MRIEDFYAELDEAQGYLALWRLRWLEAGALLAGAAAASGWLKLRLPWEIIGLVLATLLVTNLLARPGQNFVKSGYPRWALGMLTLDAALLTLLLYFTGGAHNPFTMLFLPLIVLGVILLPTAAAWSLVALTVLAFGLLFLSPHMLMSQSGEALCHDMDFHLKGMVLGLAAAGASVVYFVSSLNQALRAKHREIETLRKRMAELRKTMELGAMAASIAHEVATPLGTIAVIGRDLESLDCNAPCGEQLREDARLIREAITRCQKVLQWLSERTDGGVDSAPQAVSAALFHDQLLSFLNHSAHSRLRFSIADGPRQAAYAPLHELVINTAILIRNGLDASGENGQVDLRWESTDGQIRIRVRDEGHGMSEAVLAKVREPFFSTKAPDKGLGLGLYLVNLFCQRQGGALDITSAPDQGTTATLFLPAAK